MPKTSDIAKPRMRMPSLTVRFGICTICLMAAHAAVLRGLVDFARANSTGTHIVGVPFIALALILEDRKAILASIRPARLAGAAVTLAGLAPLLALLLRGAPSPEDSLSLSALGLVVS